MKEIKNLCIGINIVIDKCTSSFREQYFEQGTTFLLALITSISSLVEKMKEYEDSDIQLGQTAHIGNILSILNKIFMEREQFNYVKIIDLLEMELQPQINSLLEEKNDNIESELIQYYSSNYDYCKENHLILGEQIAKISFPSENMYQFKKSVSGNIILDRKFENGKSVQLNTLVKPWMEAKELIDLWITKDIEEYIVFGLGWGYHIFELLNRDKKVTVYESDEVILRLNFEYRDLIKRIWSKNGRIIFDPDLQLLKNQLKEPEIQEKKICFYYPAILNIQEVEKKNYLLNVYTQYKKLI